LFRLLTRVDQGTINRHPLYARAGYSGTALSAGENPTAVAKDNDANGAAGDG
jgi:hypothetical protein